MWHKEANEYCDLVLANLQHDRIEHDSTDFFLHPIDLVAIKEDSFHDNKSPTN